MPVQMLAHVELISVAMGLVINLLADNPANRQHLAAMQDTSSSSNDDTQHASNAGDKQQAKRRPNHRTGGGHVVAQESLQACRQQPGGSQGEGAGVVDEGSLLQLLCAVMNAATMPQQEQDEQARRQKRRRRQQQQQGADTTPSPQQQQQQQGQGQQQGQQCSMPTGSVLTNGGISCGGDSCLSMDVTEQHLHVGEALAQASILEVYSAMLLGFMVQGHVALQRRAAALLRGESLAPVVTAVERFLHFYVSAGAITAASRDALVQLLVELKQQQQQQQQQQQSEVDLHLS